MEKFIKRIALFVLQSAGLSIVVIGVYKLTTGVTWKDLPAPNLSNSYSLNDKLSFAVNKKADVVVISSSMGLDNLNSRVVTDNLKTDSYLNLSSWGMSVKDIFALIKIYSSIHKPSTIIISSNYCDFQSPDKKFDSKEIANYLAGKGSRLHYLLLNFSFGYYLKKFAYDRMIKSGNNFYQSLLYDKYGAVALNPVNFKINVKRWNKIDFEGIRDSAFDYLDSASDFCRQNRIKLLFFQCPVRDGIYEKINKNQYLAHIRRVKAIILKSGQVFIDPNDRPWADNLYVDPLHFNSIGAREFTKYCFDRYAGQQKTLLADKLASNSRLPDKDRF